MRCWPGSEQRSRARSGPCLALPDGRRRVLRAPAGRGRPDVRRGASGRPPSASAARDSRSRSRTASSGSRRRPPTPRPALRVADQRMYDQKNGKRTSAGRQTTDALLRVLMERNPLLAGHGASARRATCVALAPGVRLASPGSGSPRARGGSGRAPPRSESPRRRSARSGLRRGASPWRARGSRPRAARGGAAGLRTRAAAG